ncbi:hypothetical protein LTR36_005851 [Oleoguttula mirabilis]|uniref:Pre-rRNA-processing protein RIX1 n=1 Tax=Oleoguttula mirabilis TaxID=1507867 RepID=A0AAV9JD64_9PEZI|nr:hypothetical protein LTR36_005851 [Oleoguttula mirabilis]
MATLKTQEVAVLRAATYRLSSTPSKQLPSIAPQIAAQLWTCKDLLSSTADSAKQGNDASTVVHRFKTHLSTLLQDRTVEGRWSAVVLVKATIEAGGIEVLSKSNAWVRNLLGILKKPDPPTTRNLATIALTRIFMLTWEYSSLVREITTPALPTFVATCLSNAENKRCSASELSTVLEAFAVLLPRHPTIFRTNETQIRALLVRILSATPSSPLEGFHYTVAHQAVAQRVLVLLHHCSPKQGSAGKWDETLKAAVTSAHATCDRLFRSLLEDWKSVAGVRPSASPNALLQGEMELESNDQLGLTGWKGVYAGSERLVAHMDMIKTQTNLATAGSVTVRLGMVSDLLTRVLSLRVPYGKHNTKPNIQISTDEREALFSNMPSVHVAALQLINALLHRFGMTVVAVVLPLLSQTTWVFESEKSDVDARAATYTVLTSVLRLQGPSMAREDVADVEAIVRACCQDLLPAGDSTTSPSNGAPVQQSGATSDLGLQASKAAASAPTLHGDVRAAAEALLPLCISKLDPAYVPGRLRALVERTVVLTQHKDALVACVLNPALKGKASSAQASLLPLLAIQHPDAPEVEALLRPRMPFVRTRNTGHEDEDEADDYNEDDVGVDGHAEEDGMDGAAVDATNGAEDDNEPTDGLLSALGQQDAPAMGEELYSVSPPETVQATQNSGPGPAGAYSHAAELGAEKRRADAAPEHERSAKRMQGSPVAESLLPSGAHSLSGPDPTTVQSRVPATVVIEPPQSSYMTAPEPSQQSITLPAAPAQASASVHSQAAADVGDDDSDFEMPPLTMDASDDEEESEDDED